MWCSESLWKSHRSVYLEIANRYILWYLLQFELLPFFLKMKTISEYFISVGISSFTQVQIVLEQESNTLFKCLSLYYIRSCSLVISTTHRQQKKCFHRSALFLAVWIHKEVCHEYKIAVQRETPCRGKDLWNSKASWRQYYIFGPSKYCQALLKSIDVITIIKFNVTVSAGWKEHFEGLLNKPVTFDQHVVANIPKQPMEHSFG